MRTEFDELNAYVYHVARGVVLDGVIWCLGPYVDDSRPYGRVRCAVARWTRTLVRRWYRIADEP